MAVYVFGYQGQWGTETYTSKRAALKSLEEGEQPFAPPFTLYKAIAVCEVVGHFSLNIKPIPQRRAKGAK